MKQFSLFALTMVLSLSASAGVFCKDENNTVSIIVSENGSTEGIQQSRVRAHYADGKLEGKLDLQGYLYVSKQGKMSLLSGDPNNGLDLEINFLSDSLKTLNYSSELFINIKGKYKEVSVACIDEKNIN